MLETPVDVTVGPVLFADGAAVGEEHLQRAGLFLYRRLVAAAAVEVWNETAKAWQPPPADVTALTPLPLILKAGEPQPWQGVVVAVGQKDAAGRERIGKAVGGFPRYALRAFVEARRDGAAYAGLGAPSIEWQFASATDSARFAVTFDTPETTPPQATRARVQLKSAALVPAGFLEVRATGGNEVEIASCDAAGAIRARILLSGTGDIHLAPAAGRRVIVDGGLLVNGLLETNP